MNEDPEITGAINKPVMPDLTPRSGYEDLLRRDEVYGERTPSRPEPIGDMPAQIDQVTSITDLQESLADALNLVNKHDDDNSIAYLKTIVRQIQNLSTDPDIAGTILNNQVLIGLRPGAVVEFFEAFSPEFPITGQDRTAPEWTAAQVAQRVLKYADDAEEFKDKSRAEISKALAVAPYQISRAYGMRAWVTDQICAKYGIQS